MYITISFWHGPKWMLRARRVSDGSQDPNDKHFIYVLDPESEGAFPYSVGHAGEGDDLRHCIIEGADVNINGWKHDFTFYAYKTERLGAIPYAVGHTNYKDGVKYRVTENATFAGDHGWSHDFVFYAYSGKSDGTMLISVGSKYDVSDWFSPKLTLGVTARDGTFKHVTVFKGFVKKHSGTTPISAGYYGEGNQRRYIISKGTSVGPSWDIWRKDFTFYGFLAAREGTIPLTVDYTTNYWGGTDSLMCMKESRDVIGCGGDGFIFHVYPFDRSLLIEVAVGLESEYWCYMLKPDVCKLRDSRFMHEFTFFGFRSPYPGTLPISVGKAGAEHNNTLRNRVEFGNFAGSRGWEHEFIVYVFPKEEPGTIPIAVGHADFLLGGWKYRVCENCKDAGTKGWIHDFVFYAYPHPPDH